MQIRLLLAATLTLAAVPAVAQKVAPSIAAALAATDRPDADKARDAERKPAEMLAFAGVKPGDQVADLLPGGGYFTRLFAKAVGPKGHVYAVAPAGHDEAVQALAAEPGYANVSVVALAPSGYATAGSLDLVWTSQNWHDVYNRGPEAIAAFDRAAFQALKPGGTYVVLDHAAAAGAADAPKTLHRIDPAVVKAQVLKAGFRFVGESAALRNPADPHSAAVFDPSIRGKTDQFVYKFRKP